MARRPNTENENADQAAPQPQQASAETGGTANFDQGLANHQRQTSEALEETIQKQRQARIDAAEQATQKAADENRLPASTPVANPAPGNVMNSGGAFVEPEVLNVDLEHPSVENNPRVGTSAVQNGADFNDPNRRVPDDPNFAGQGLDLSVYGR